MALLSARHRAVDCEAMKSRTPAIGFIFFTLFIDILGIGLVIPVLPKLIEQYAGGETSNAAFYTGILTAVYAAMQFICAPILGSLSDQYGRRPVLLLALFGLGVDYLLLAFAPNLAWLFVGRVIAGATSASISTATAYIADVSPPEKRAQNFGLVGAAFGLGFIAGPALGGILGNVGLQTPFLVAAGLTLLNWLYGFFILPESLKPENRRPFSWSRANPIGSLAALARYPVVLSLTASIVLSNLAQLGLQSTWVLYTDYKFNWTPGDVGISLAVVGLTAAIMQGGLIRVLLPIFGEKKAIIIGQVTSIISFTLYGLATQGWMMYAIIAAGAIGSIGGPATQGMISRGVPDNEQGALQGSISSLGSLTGVVGPLLSNTAFGYFISEAAPVKIPGIAFFMGAVFLAISLVLVLRAFQNPIFDQPLKT
jgi:MFS transporter, DHA1 family, tetracycline resistance protein